MLNVGIQYKALIDSFESWKQTTFWVYFHFPFLWIYRDPMGSDDSSLFRLLSL